MRIRYAAACLAACAALALGAARAEWYVFEPDDPPEALLEASMQVSGFSGEVTLSFLGDCTLGGGKQGGQQPRWLCSDRAARGIRLPLPKPQGPAGRRRCHRGEPGGRS